jgi:hypothetical protein
MVVAVVLRDHQVHLVLVGAEMVHQVLLALLVFQWDPLFQLEVVVLLLHPLHLDIQLRHYLLFLCRRQLPSQQTLVHGPLSCLIIVHINL